MDEKRQGARRSANELHEVHVEAVAFTCPSCGASFNLQGACPSCGAIVSVPNSHRMVGIQHEVIAPPEDRLTPEQISVIWKDYIYPQGYPSLRISSYEGSKPKNVLDEEFFYLIQAVEVILERFDPQVWSQLIGEWGLSDRHISFDGNASLVATRVVQNALDHGIPRDILLLQMVDRFWGEPQGSLQSQKLKSVLTLYRQFKARVRNPDAHVAAPQEVEQAFTGSDPNFMSWWIRANRDEKNGRGLQRQEQVIGVLHGCPKCGYSFELPGTCPRCAFEVTREYVQQSGHPDQVPMGIMGWDSMVRVSESRFKNKLPTLSSHKLTPTETQYVKSMLLSILSGKTGNDARVVFRHWGFSPRILGQISFSGAEVNEDNVQEYIDKFFGYGTPANVLCLQMIDRYYGGREGFGLRAPTLKAFLTIYQETAMGEAVDELSPSRLAEEDEKFNAWWHKINLEEPNRSRESTYVVEEYVVATCPQCGAQTRMPGVCSSCKSELSYPSNFRQADRLTIVPPNLMHANDVREARKVLHENPSFAGLFKMNVSDEAVEYLSRSLATILSKLNSTERFNVLTGWSVISEEMSGQIVTTDTALRLAYDVVRMCLDQFPESILLLQMIDRYWGDGEGFGLKSGVLKQLLTFYEEAATGRLKNEPYKEVDDTEFKQWWKRLMHQPEPDLTSTPPSEIPDGLTRADVFSVLQTLPDKNAQDLDIGWEGGVELFKAAVRTMTLKVPVGMNERVAWWLSRGISNEVLCEVNAFNSPMVFGQQVVSYPFDRLARMDNIDEQKRGLYLHYTKSPLNVDKVMTLQLLRHEGIPMTQEMNNILDFFIARTKGERGHLPTSLLARSRD